MPDLKTLCSHLEALGRNRPNADARAKLELALQSKWDGVRVTAAKSLCAWGDEMSLRAVKQAMSHLASKPARWANTGAMASALGPHMSESDLEWAVGLLVREAHIDNVLELHALMDHFPAHKLLELLEQSLKGVSVERRLVAVKFIKRRTENRIASPDA